METQVDYREFSEIVGDKYRMYEDGLISLDILEQSIREAIWRLGFSED